MRLWFFLTAKRSWCRCAYSVSSSSSWYYATFEFPSGDRREFLVSGQESGLLAEGDHGRLTYQGTRYRRFERDRPPGTSIGNTGG